MIITSKQLERIAILAYTAYRVDVRRPNNLDALPEGYVVVDVWYPKVDHPLVCGIDPEGRASS